MTLREQLIRDEGVRLKPYLDCCGRYWRECDCKDKGNLTIGVGRNLDATGISHIEALSMLDSDIAEKKRQLMSLIPWAANLDDARFDALVNLAFNMGARGLVENNPKFLLKLRYSDYAGAAAELLDGRYKCQVGHKDGEAHACRAHRIAKQIESGKWI